MERTTDNTPAIIKVQLANINRMTNAVIALVKQKDRTPLMRIDILRKMLSNTRVGGFTRCSVQDHVSFVTKFRK